jgi:NRPS condensation-like uncharacterized protein
MQESTIQGFQLSRQQKYLWSPDTGTAKTQILLDISGSLNADLLKRALYALVVRHEILRTSFHSLNGMQYPLQSINDEARLSWQHLSLSRFDSNEQVNRINKTCNGERYLALDFENDALLRCILFARTATHATLLITAPSLIADGQTLKILLQELSQAYGELVPSVHDDEDEPIQYAQFAAWQNEELEDKTMSEDTYQFWQQQQIFLSQPPTLPFTQKKVASTSLATSSYTVLLSDTTCTAMTNLADHYEATLEDVLLTSWQLLLWQLSHEPDVVVGYQVSGRDYAELANIPGPFAHTVPLHTHFNDDTTFIELLHAVRTTRQHAQEWQEDYEFAPHLYDTQQPSFYAGFDFTESTTTFRVNDISFSLASIATYVERFSITLSCLLQAQTLRATLRCDIGKLDSNHRRCLFNLERNLPFLASHQCFLVLE